MMRGPVTALALTLTALALTPAAKAATLIPSLIPSLEPEIAQIRPDMSHGNLPAWDGSDLSGAHLWPGLWAPATRRSQRFALQDQPFTLSLQLMLEGAPPVPLDWFTPRSAPPLAALTDLVVYRFEIGWSGTRISPPAFAAPRFIAPVPLPSGLPLLLSALALLRRRRARPVIRAQTPAGAAGSGP